MLHLTLFIFCFSLVYIRKDYIWSRWVPILEYNRDAGEKWSNDRKALHFDFNCSSDFRLPRTSGWMLGEIPRLFADFQDFKLILSSDYDLRLTSRDAQWFASAYIAIKIIRKLICPPFLAFLPLADWSELVVLVMHLIDTMRDVTKINLWTGDSTPTRVNSCLHHTSGIMRIAPYWREVEQPTHAYTDMHRIERQNDSVRY